MDTALRLAAIAFLLRPMGPWFVRPVILAAAVVALIFPRALRSSVLWATVAAAIAVRIAEDWPLADNHIYLLGYWCLAIAIALRRPDPEPSLLFSSRSLLGLAFAFAVLWKAVLSPDFLDGRFFRVTLLTDPRFGSASRLVGGLSAAELEANRQALAVLPHGAELHDPPMIHEPYRLKTFSTVSTWGILALESAVALSMLVPLRGRVVVLRHAALLSFCAITYAFAPVAGFGWLLLAMGLAQLEPRQVWLTRAYVAAFLVVLFYDELPWSDLAVAYFS